MHQFPRNGITNACAYIVITSRVSQSKTAFFETCVNVNVKRICLALFTVGFFGKLNQNSFIVFHYILQDFLPTEYKKIRIKCTPCTYDNELNFHKIHSLRNQNLMKIWAVTDFPDNLKQSVQPLILCSKSDVPGFRHPFLCTVNGVLSQGECMETNASVAILAVRLCVCVHWHNNAKVRSQHVYTKQCAQNITTSVLALRLCLSSSALLINIER